MVFGINSIYGNLQPLVTVFFQSLNLIFIEQIAIGYQQEKRSVIMEYVHNIKQRVA